MTNKQTLTICALLLGLFTGCTQEETGAVPGERKANEWVQDVMQAHYLWNDDMPDGAAGLSGGTEDYFHSLLSDQDGKDQYTNGVKTGHYYYSTIKQTGGQTKAYMGDGLSYGFEYQHYKFTKQNIYALLVLYVLPGSPAEAAGVERGHWIVGIDGQPVPATTASLLEQLDPSAKANVALDIRRDAGSTATYTATLTAAQVTDNPVFLHKVITLDDNRKVGYLVYNHFTAAPAGSMEKTFDNALRQAFASFAAGPHLDEFILDLRYNGGGLVSSSQLLATMLAPASALGDVYCHLEDTDGKVSTLVLDDGLIGEGANLDLGRLYVITSTWTASASEAVINGLRPYAEVVLAGEKTEGKNVGSSTFDGSSYGWELHPITHLISNKNGADDDYPGGFPPTPGFTCNEADAETIYALGDEREYILGKLLRYIRYGTPVEALRSSTLHPAGSPALLPLYCSLERRRAAAVVPPSVKTDGKR